MALKAPEIYQGGDWMTYRWSVAQVFDTLDRMRELTHTPTPHVLPNLHGAALFQDEDLQDEEMADMFAGIVDLCDNLSGELDIVFADIIPQHGNAVMQRWTGFELRLHLNSIRQQALQEHQVSEPSTAVMDAIAARSSRMRDLLKQIDQ
jgi:hypothetical protein